MTFDQLITTWATQLTERQETLARDLLDRRHEFSEEELVDKMCELMAFEFRCGMEMAAAVFSRTPPELVSYVLERHLSNGVETEA